MTLPGALRGVEPGQRAGIKDVLAGDHLILDQILLAARKHYLRYWKNL